jgi:2-keto-4-pentenoate hydratase/2-oxohepta-3-ene-1,7-dioic acid hydratase in catechol pathway
VSAELRPGDIISPGSPAGISPHRPDAAEGAIEGVGGVPQSRDREVEES